MMRRATFLAALLLALPACAGEISDSGGVEVGDVGDDYALDGVEENDGVAFASTLAAGDTARVCQTGGSGLRQRSGPGTSYDILRTMPEGSTTKILSSSSGWYKNDWGGRVGWSHGGYLCKVESSGSTDGGSTGGGGFDAPLSRDGIIQIANAGVGFSYWWGGGRFADGAAHGACYGSCPDCDHSGSYGGDCSGYAAKVWKLPEAMPMNVNKHPFSTYHFRNQSNHWSSVSRANVLRADALVYNQDGKGHIFIYEKGDPWGSMWAFEARGCSYGVVHNVRTAGSAYRGIRRDGI